MTRASLGIPDLPLTFWLQCGLARILESLGWDLEPAILLAVKLSDSLLPTLLIWPLWWLFASWARQIGRGPGIPRLLAFLAVAGGSAVVLLGDFQKNALGLVILGFLVLALERGAYGLAALFLGLLGLTHIGVFATALVLTGCFALAQGRLRKSLIWLGLAVVLSWSLAGGFDGERQGRLLQAVLHPIAFLHQKGGPPGHGPPPTHWVPTLALWALSLPALRFLGAARPRQKALLQACAATAVLLAGPWMSSDYGMRLALNLYVLGLVNCAWCLMQLARPSWRWGLSLLVGCLALLPNLRPKQPILNAQALQELGSLSRQIQPTQTLVVAPHGVEWWTAWLLRCRISQPQALLEEDRHTYQVYWLQPLHSQQPQLPGQAQMPEDAEVVFRGQHFLLGKLPRLGIEGTPPRLPSLPEQSQSPSAVNQTLGL